jgi:hypothetical protein
MPGDDTASSSSLQTPSGPELARLPTWEDWTFFVARANPDAEAMSIWRAYEASGAKQHFGTTLMPFQMRRLVEIARAGDAAVADYQRERAQERDQRAALDRCADWDEWARSYIAAHDDDGARDVVHAMALYGYGRLGPPPTPAAIEELQLELGAAGMTPERLASSRQEAATHERERETRILNWRDALVGRLGATPPWATAGHRRRALDVRAFERALALRNGKRTGSLPSIPLAQEPLSPLTRSVLGALKLPPELESFLARFSFPLDVGLGDAVYSRANQLVYENWDERYLDHGLLAIGSVDDGDILVVDLATLSVGLLDHEELAAAASPRQVSIDSGLDLGRFFLAAARGRMPAPRRPLVKVGLVLLLMVIVALLAGGLLRAHGVR